MFKLILIIEQIIVFIGNYQAFQSWLFLLSNYVINVDVQNVYMRGDCVLCRQLKIYLIIANQNVRSTQVKLRTALYLVKENTYGSDTSVLVSLEVKSTSLSYYTYCQNQNGLKPHKRALIMIFSKIMGNHAKALKFKNI